MLRYGGSNGSGERLPRPGGLPGNAIESNADYASLVFTVGYSQHEVDSDIASAIIAERG